LKIEKRIAIGVLRTQLNLLGWVSPGKAAAKAFQLFCTPQKKTIKNSPELIAQAEKLELLTNGQKVIGYRWNKHEGSRKLLIIHGFESTARNFEMYVTRMTAKGYEVLAFDAPAHGESEGTQINVLIYKEMLEEIIRSFGPFHAFLAHSFGGLAICLALEDMPHAHDVKLVLIAPATETTTAVDLLFRILQLNGKVRRAFNDLIVEIGKRPVEWYSVSRSIEHIHADTLWVQDEDDDVTPFHDVKPVIEKKPPNVEFLLTKGLGHRRIYRDEKVIEKIISFIEK
jgi:pimeloyl-ACP methyl ester carboxylesterase